MNSDQAREWMLRYVDGSLPDDGVRELNRHLRVDPSARAEFAELLVQCVQLPKLGQVAALEAPHPRTLSRTRRAAAAAVLLLGASVVLTLHDSRGKAPESAAKSSETRGLVAPDTASPADPGQPFAAEEERPREGERVPSEVGRIAEAHGDVFLLTPSGRIPIPPEGRILSGQGLETGIGESFVLVVLKDRARLLVGSNTRLPEVSDHRVVVDVGVVSAEVSRAGRPFILSTGQGDVRVRVETELRVQAGRDATRLDVMRGEAELKGRDGKSAAVPFGCFASAGPGIRPAAAWKGPGSDAARRLSLSGSVTINFGPAQTGLPEGVLNDSGEEFDDRRGYGWKGPKAGRELPGEFLTRPDGTRVPQRGGREPWLSEARVDALGILRASSIVAGWKHHTETWGFRLANGRYWVSICCGDAERPQGPHHVAVEGVQAVNALDTKAGEFVGVLDLPVEVRDGELTLVVGGSGKVRPDGDGDTSLNFLVVKRAPE